jgi:hypothetical protein
MFKNPPKIYQPETLVYLLGGNTSKVGITADFEAIKAAGIEGVLLFHGEMGGFWSKISDPIPCLSPKWDDLIRHIGNEAKRLDLRLTMLNCAGWAMSGGPWVKPENAMRHLKFARININIGTNSDKNIVIKSVGGLDYRDVCVLAFPTPLEDDHSILKAESVKAECVSLPNYDWKKWFDGKAGAVNLPENKEYGKYNKTIIDIVLEKPATVRTIVFPSIEGMNHAFAYEPGIKVKVEAILDNSETKTVCETELPQSNWQDSGTQCSLSCDEAGETSEVKVKTYRVTIENQHNMRLTPFWLKTAAQQNNWEGEAAWTLRGHIRNRDLPKQNPKCFISSDKIVDVTRFFDYKTETLDWNQAGAGISSDVKSWTFLRIGHVCTGAQNGPSPPEGRGYECDKLSPDGATVVFENFIGRLIAKGGALEGKLAGMHLDSWECARQTWTKNMPDEFQKRNQYDVLKYLPAIFGYVIDDNETTLRFLTDWRSTINDLLVNNYYGTMSKLAHQHGLTLSSETAGGDVFPADIMEYYKSADVPMTEFWQPKTDGKRIGEGKGFVGSINFKPIKPAASAMRLYGKRRLSAEALTSFSLTWDEHFDMLKEVCNINMIDGVTHIMFHTYTHHPTTDYLPPGTSFAAGIGTPFCRKQTWWKFMPEFNQYLARVNYMLERGKPVSDILWYLGDEVSHKPNQRIELDRFKYDYCNPDVLLNRLKVVNDGVYPVLSTPEGLTYRILYLPDNVLMRPDTLEKIAEFAKAGVIIIGNPPKGLATLSNNAENQKRFDKAVKEIWKNTTKDKKDKDDDSQMFVKFAGVEMFMWNNDVDDSLEVDFVADDDILLWQHRQTAGADWYFVCPKHGEKFDGIISVRNKYENAEIWDTVTGEITPVAVDHIAVDHDNDNRTIIELHLLPSESRFVVFRKVSGQNNEQTLTPVTNKEEAPIVITNDWTLTFPSGWGIDKPLTLQELKAWKDLDVSPEGKAFSGTATYTTKFKIDGTSSVVKRVVLDLGDVDMVAEVFVNGKKVRTLWAKPYKADVTEFVKDGDNELRVDVTSTFFNRLVYDAEQPVEQRKTWTISGPKAKQPLRSSGLLGPVQILTVK